MALEQAAQSTEIYMPSLFRRIGKGGSDATRPPPGETEADSAPNGAFLLPHATNDARTGDIRPRRRRLPFESYIEEGARRGIQWTTLRKAVLRLVWQTQEPLGAYEIARRLRIGDKTFHPTAAYRCLHCLLQAGLVLPILSWKRYFLSPDPAVKLWGLLLCSSCRSCTPLPLRHEHDALTGMLRDRGFRPLLPAVEAKGSCAGCRSRPAPA